MTDKPAPAAAATPPAPAGVPEIDEENAIFFASGSSRLDADGERKLQRHAARLKTDPKLSVTLVGHTDDLGSRSYNIAIAEQRTTAVAGQLLAAGVRRTQIRRYSMGHEKAAEACRTAACRQKMRRVDLIFEE